MKVIFCIFAFILFFNTGYSQVVAIECQNTIGGSDEDYLHSLVQTSDKGFILGGTSYSEISGDKTEIVMGADDYWIVKTDSTCNIQWQNTIGGNGYEQLYSIQQTTDGGYILGGSSFSDISGDKTENGNGGYDYWIVKTDLFGNIQWQNTIGGSDYDWLRSIQQTADGGYILGGDSYSDISGDKLENNWDTSGLSVDYWVVKTDSIGNIQWQNTIGGDQLDKLSQICQTTDKGYILGGQSFSNNTGDKTEMSLGWDDFWIIKIDSLGNIEWQNTIGGNYSEELASIQQTIEGGFILFGTSGSDISGDKTEPVIGEGDYWLVKTDSVGNIQWQNTIGGNDIDISTSIQQTTDGGYILGGVSLSDIYGDKTEACLGELDYWIVKTDSNGNILWQNTIGGSRWEILTSINQTYDGGFILGGYSNSDSTGHKSENSNGKNDYWIIKLGSCTIIYYVDNDGDGFGDSLSDSIACSIPLGYVLDNNDCDDSNPFIYPGAPEQFNGLDDDCDDQIDEFLGIENELESQFIIYPNPAEDHLIVESTTSESFEIEIFDAAGKSLLKERTSSFKEIYLDHFSPGIYFIKFTTESESVGMSFIKEY